MASGDLRSAAVSADLHQLVGEVSGKLDTLMDTLKQWQADHNARHEKIDEKLEEHAADINQAKGAKRATLALAGAAATVISLAVAAAGKFL